MKKISLKNILKKTFKNKKKKAKVKKKAAPKKIIKKIIKPKVSKIKPLKKTKQKKAKEALVNKPSNLKIVKDKIILLCVEILRIKIDSISSFMKYITVLNFQNFRTSVLDLLD